MCGGTRPPNGVVCPNDLHELMPANEDPLLGQPVGTYRVLKRLGIGGMGAVYEAVETNIDKRAALKIVHPHLSEDPRLPTLLAEAKAVNAIGDEGIVDIHGFGKLPDGRSYLVMELLEGELLEARLHRQGTFGLLEAIDLCAPLLQSLHAAHTAGFVHRDIKVGNVFVVLRPNRPPFPKLLDFGIAQKTSAAATQAVGTPEYIAPEQAENVNVGPRSDLFAFGCLFYELLTGHVPWRDPDGMKVVYMHMHAPRPHVRDERPDVPEEVDALLVALLQANPAHRPASAAEVRDILLGVRQRLMPKPRPRWLIPAGAGVVALLALATFLIPERRVEVVAPPPDPVKLAVARAVADIEGALDAGEFPAALDRLAAAEASFPGAPDWEAIQGTLRDGLRREVQGDLERDDETAAMGSMTRLLKLGPLPEGDSLAAQFRRLTFAMHNGMAHVEGVWVDRYEYPNRMGATPTTKVDWADAARLCETAGKRLCTEQEWEIVCSGSAGRKFPYGDTFDKARCRIKGKKAHAAVVSGRFAGCTTPEGVFDLSGNVAEWTASAVKDGSPQKVIRGGSFSQTDAKLGCSARDYFLPGQGGAPHLGFRCCL